MTHSTVRIAAASVESALVLRVSGSLVGSAVETAADELTDVSAFAVPPAVVVLDVRTVTALSASGARMLGAFLGGLGDRGVRTAVVTRDEATSRILDVALPGVSRYRTVDAAVAAQSDLANPEDALGDQLAALTRVLLEATTVEQALRQIVGATMVVIPHAEVVSVTLRDPDGRFHTPVETAAVATALDQVQYATGIGPCVDAARPDGPGYSLDHDLTRPGAWPRFADTATGLGLGSVLATALQQSTSPAAVRGALNIYSHRHGITDQDRHRALLLATHASLALAHGNAAVVADLREANLTRAVESRDVIGQAKGILMARQGLTADEAFDLLRRTSQDLNVKLAEIAATLVGRHTELPPATR
ncbi:ANTAR domain-containing protein [Amycolatopsis sp., V23-08]|uniref:ANTAR domain-containing protein n=1 Tax=Amycolatopsis heterodermiae TaxID=3110235 RepID=A0ABU5R5Q4_9PSEU|nr:ANTAR domain-containing protein [Amycolatopsis sp., V23-08]MEA5361000.1 ANTAR domain-containing protein [Amycolatopsis sp., V23-08]